jgi:hypothetical protein
LEEAAEPFAESLGLFCARGEGAGALGTAGLPAGGGVLTFPWGTVEDGGAEDAMGGEVAAAGCPDTDATLVPVTPGVLIVKAPVPVLSETEAPPLVFGCLEGILAFKTPINKAKTTLNSINLVTRTRGNQDSTKSTRTAVRLASDRIPSIKITQFQE